MPAVSPIQEAAVYAAHWYMLALTLEKTGTAGVSHFMSHRMDTATWPPRSQGRPEYHGFQTQLRAHARPESIMAALKCAHWPKLVYKTTDMQWVRAHSLLWYITAPCMHAGSTGRQERPSQRPPSTLNSLQFEVIHGMPPMKAS